MVREDLPSLNAAALAWLASALFIVYGGAIPFHFDWNTADAGARLRWVLNLGLPRHVSSADVLQNVLLFVPFGAFGYLAAKRRGVLRMVLVTAAAALLSMSVECLQLFTLDRTASFIDVITDTTGALMGAAAVPIGMAIWEPVSAVAASLRWFAPREWRPVALALGVTMAAAWEPFDATLDVGSIRHKLSALSHAPWQRPAFGDELLYIGRYAALAGLGAAWLRVVGVRRPGLWATLGAAFLAIALEASQFFIDSRMPLPYEAAVAIAGVLLGSAVWLFAADRPRSGGVAAAIIAWTFVAAAVSMLAPFKRAGTPTPFNWMPFLSAYEFTTASNVSHVIEVVLLYVPVGAAFAWVRPRSVTSYAAASVLAAAMQSPLEYLQAWIPGRHPDITDILLAALGAGLGVWAARRLKPAHRLRSNDSSRSHRTAAVTG